MYTALLALGVDLWTWKMKNVKVYDFKRNGMFVGFIRMVNVNISDKKRI